MHDKAHDIKKRADSLFASAERTTTELVWQELLEFFLNNQAVNASSMASSLDISSTGVGVAGAKKTRRVFDSTALNAVQSLAAILQGTLTNPTTKWSNSRHSISELNKDPAVQKYFEQLNDIVFTKLNESNFNIEIAKDFQSFVTLANSVMFIEEDLKKGGVKFTSWHMSKVAWTENADGEPESFFRKFSFSAAQAFESWGNNNHPNLLKALAEDPEKQFEFLHIVKPRDPSKVELNEQGLAPADKRPIESLYYDQQHSNLVEEGGYYELPVVAARWSLMPGEIYGRGPSHLALPDVRSLNQLVQRGLEALDMHVWAPILVNRKDVFGPLDMRPKRVSVVKDHRGITQFRPEGRPDVVNFTVERLQTTIEKAFFLDRLLLPPRTETGEQTAEEIRARIEQVQRVMGPVVSRIIHEKLTPTIDRVVSILARNGELPPLPPILEQFGLQIKTTFINPLAKSQQMHEVNAIMNWLGVLGQAAQFDPTILDNADGDAIADVTGTVFGVPTSVQRSDEEMAMLREQRAKQAEQAQALEAGVKMADISAKSAKSNPNN